ncbi:MAG: PRC-barrel domain-containing protein [Actinomycetota bacterium]|nr:PRC-barrel domain-containing protein [Actinomycetota bacterium]
MDRADVVGWAVRNYEGDSLGKVDEVTRDPDTGEVTHVVVKSGGFFGGEQESLPVDWDSLEIDEDNQIVMVQASKDSFWKPGEGPSGSDRGRMTPH